MKFCPNCGTEINIENGSCPECGFKIDELPERKEVESSPLHKYCSHCGFKLLKEAIICPNCGCQTNDSNVIKNEASANHEDKLSNNKAGLGFGIASIVISFVSLFVFGWAGFIGFSFGIPGVIISAVCKIKKGIKIPGIIISAVGCVLGLIAGFGWIYYYA